MSERREDVFSGLDVQRVAHSLAQVEQVYREAVTAGHGVTIGLVDGVPHATADEGLRRGEVQYVWPG